MNQEYINTHRNLVTEIPKDLLLAYNQGFFRTKTRSLIYILLLKNGKVTARELQDDYGITEGTAYRALKDMLEESLIEVIGHEPKPYKRGGPETTIYVLNGEGGY